MILPAASQNGNKFIYLSDALSSIIPGSAITLLGLIACFQANRRGDNQDFIARFFAISVPISVRLFMVTISIFLIEQIVIRTLAGFPFLDMGSLTIFNSVFGHFLDICYYMWVRSKLLYISGSKG